jgi:hypothetical protein
MKFETKDNLVFSIKPLCELISTEFVEKIKVPKYVGRPLMECHAEEEAILDIERRKGEKIEAKNIQEARHEKERKLVNNLVH